MFKKSGPAKVEAAFGLFTKAISDLEGAVDQCNAERNAYATQIAALEAKDYEAKTAAAKAATAIGNLRDLIGG
jgi:hypothetical protein